MSRGPLASSLILAAAAAVILALPVFAKDGAEAKLDTTLSRDAQPGSTIDVGWSVASIEDGQSIPITGLPVFVRLVGPGAASVTEVRGTETPPGSGHYTASIQVPDGGIANVFVGMRGESCTAAACGRADMIFPLTDDPLVTGLAPIAASTAAPPASASIGSQLAPFVGIGIAVAVAGGLAAFVVGRRRMAQAPAGR
jgi:hypothetical protein